MFILPPNCIVPSATLLTMSPVFPSFLYFISHTPSAENEDSDIRHTSRVASGKVRTSVKGNGTSDQPSLRLISRASWKEHFNRHLREAHIFTPLARNCFQVFERISPPHCFLTVHSLRRRSLCR